MEENDNRPESEDDSPDSPMSPERARRFCDTQEDFAKFWQGVHLKPSPAPEEPIPEGRTED